MKNSSDNNLKMERRSFLKGALATAGAVALVSGCKEDAKAPVPSCPPPEPCPAPEKPPLPDHLNPADFHMHNAQPLALETKRSAFGASVITPASKMFVRNNLPMPDASIVARANEWTIEFDGVGQGKSLSLPELKQLGLDTETTVLQCSGNGRKYYPHKPSGSPWGIGAAACSIWTGVRLSTVLEHLGGAQTGKNFVTATGGEELPEGVDRDTVIVERSIPLAKGLKDALLAWELNGAPIPITHGGPLRLIVPGYYGVNNVKYVKRIALTEYESSAKIQKKGYRVRPLGEKGDPSQPSMWRMDVKSWFNGPGADDTKVLAGKVRLHGVAFSGERGVKKVEYSFDGTSWSEAELVGPDLGENAWRQFVVIADMKPGEYTVYSRATDSEGEVQPEERVLNERGYKNNSWRDMAHTFEVVTELPAYVEPVAAAAGTTPQKKARKQVALSDEAKAGRKVFTTDGTPPCSACHTLSEAEATATVGPDLDTLKPDLQRVESAITNGVGAMPSYKETLDADALKSVAKYVVEATK